MIPEPAACEALFRATPRRFWGSEITAGGNLRFPEALSYPRTVGVVGGVIDLRALESLFATGRSRA